MTTKLVILHSHNKASAIHKAGCADIQKAWKDVYDFNVWDFDGTTLTDLANYLVEDFGGEADFNAELEYATRVTKPCTGLK